MTASDLLVDLTRLGIQLKADGDRLGYRPQSAVTPDLDNRLDIHKEELLAILTSSCDLGRCVDCSEPLVGVPTFDGYLNRFCRACGKWHRCRLAEEARRTSFLTLNT